MALNGPMHTTLKRVTLPVSQNAESFGAQFPSREKLILDYVPHELRLQFLCATFSADMQRTSEGSQFLIPRSEMNDRNPALL
jgi:hypothetical protein